MKTLNYIAVLVITVALLTAYGKWPRIEGKLVSHRAFREAVANIYPNRVTYHFVAEDKPTISELRESHIPESNEDLSKALYAIMMVESGGDENAMGDLGLKHPAYGAFQIRQPYLDDVHRIAGDVVEGTWGRKLTIEDMKDTSKAQWVSRTYLEHYGRRYHGLTGRVPDVGVYARIHNGGPNGWKRSATNEHYRKVMKVFADLIDG